MNLEDIKQIVELMQCNDLAEFELEEQGFRIAIKRRSAAEPVSVIAAAPASVPVAPAAPAPQPSIPTTPGTGTPAPAADPEAGWLEIKAPIVGTFYRASAPDAEPFVSIGQTVEEDTVVGIIEAMKVMNEIKAEARGVIRRILVENAQPVQFGQVLFKVEPC